MANHMEKWLESERERLPLWLPVGVGGGIAIWEIYHGVALIPIIMLSIILVLIGFVGKAGSYLRVISIFAAISIIAGYASISIKSYIISDEALERPWVGQFYGRITLVENLTARQKYRLTLETDGHNNLPKLVRVNLSPEQYRSGFTSGAIVNMRARLMPPAPPALPGGYDFSRRAWFAQLGASGSVLGEVKLYARAPNTPLLQNMRGSLSSHVQSRISKSEGSIAAALATGDTGAISDADATAMRESGMAHLLSISGLHVTAIVGGIFLFASRLLALWQWFALRYRVPVIAATISAIGAIGYTLLTGAEVPTIRSCIAALLILTALIMGREVLSLRMVAAGAMFVMVLWPETLAGPSFQLSFAAVTTIIILHEQKWMEHLRSAPEEAYWRRGMRGLISLLLTGLAIEIVLSPIALFHFHKTGIYGALANMVAIPLTTFVIMPFEFLALLFDGLGAGAPFWWVVEKSLSIILALAHYTSSLPGAVTMRPEMPLWAYAAIILGGLWLAIFQKWPRLLSIPIMIIGAIGMIFAPRPDLLITSDGKHLAIVDIKDGDNERIILLRARAGEYIRDILRESAGMKQSAIDIENYDGAICSPDSCVISIYDGHKEWRILATRTSNLIGEMELAAACKRVDIVVSDRYLPYSCKPRWRKFDRRSLKETGGVAVYLENERIDSVNSGLKNAPWFRGGEKP